MSTRTQSILRISALLVLAAIISVLLFGRGVLTGHKHAVQAAPQAKATLAQSSGRKVLYWYDPMHPTYKSDKPGIAPDCGMDLVPMYEGQGGVENGMIKVPPERQRVLGVRTAQVAESNVSRTLRTSGVVVPDESRISHVHVKTPGWIENVYVDFVGQMVKQGQPLFTVYSPDLVASQEEYLIAKRGQQSLGNSPYKDVAQNSQSLLESARRRLELWDMSAEQIHKLDQTGEVSRTITICSPHSGFVTDRKAFPHTSIDGNTEIYTLVDLSRVWVMADIYESELPYVKVGQHAAIKLSYVPGKEFAGRVTYSYPTLDPQTHTAKMRIDVPNLGLLLKPNMFADVELQINYGKHLVVPEGAVLNSGTMQTVFVVHEDGKFEPREVTVGPTVDGQTIIEFGLEKGETIVTSGNFLLDSESRMKSGSQQ
ncbi:MAG TPA: efflux RND transporter periplasmic adaptor subunit [candidate division Zixibacteria bacterium]|nr:efflux RND transporter periplasmic adaptor subunit [candidate division Zixibacteria bacterium]